MRSCCRRHNLLARHNTNRATLEMWLQFLTTRHRLVHFRCQLCHPCRCPSQQLLELIRRLPLWCQTCFQQTSCRQIPSRRTFQAPGRRFQAARRFSKALHTPASMAARTSNTLQAVRRRTFPLSCSMRRNLHLSRRLGTLNSQLYQRHRLRNKYLLHRACQRYHNNRSRTCNDHSSAR